MTLDESNTRAPARIQLNKDNREAATALFNDAVPTNLIGKNIEKQLKMKHGVDFNVKKVQTIARTSAGTNNSTTTGGARAMMGRNSLNVQPMVDLTP